MSNEKFMPSMVVNSSQKEQAKAQQEQERAKNTTNNDETAESKLQIASKLCIEQRDVRFPLAQANEKMLIEVFNPQSRFATTILFCGKDLIDYRSFTLKLAEHLTYLESTVNSKNFPKFRELLHKKAPRKVVYGCAGSQFGRYVYKNAEISYEPFGIIYASKLDQTKDYDCIENSLIDVENKCRPELAFIEQNPKDIMLRFFLNFSQCFRDTKTQLCFAGVLAVCFWDLFMTELKGFPVSFLLGDTHSGKSTLLLLISAIFGLDDSSLMAGTSTTYAMTKELGSRIAIPVCIEELDSGFFEKSAEKFVKNVYDRISRERGTKTGIEKLPIFTTFVATSNYSFSEPTEALLSRVLFSTMKRKDFDSANFKYFSEASRKELSLILPLLLSYRSRVIPLYNEVYARLAKIIKKTSGDRYLRSVAIACTMWGIVNNILGIKLFHWWQMAIDYCSVYESLLNSKVTDADVILRHITKLVREKHLVYGNHYQLIHGSILRLNLRKFVALFNVTLASGVDTMMTPNSFCSAVAGDKRFDTVRKNMKTIGRAISIDISREELLLEFALKQKSEQSYGGRYEDETEEDILDETEGEK